MSSIRSRDTKPELLLRKLLSSLGCRYRLYSADLPGKPDIVFRRMKKVIFLHGCFWHCHTRCIDGRKPKSNKGYWNPKLLANVARDKRNSKALRKTGWKTLVIWECQLKNESKVKLKLEKFLS